MRSEYKRDMNHNYLILYGEEEMDTGSYQVRMLVGNVIPSLLKCRIQGMDGKFMVYYDITSKQSVSSLYEQKKFGMEDLRLIFGGFVQVMEQMAEYLVNPGQLVIRPEYIFLDFEKREVFFCCLPGFERDVREQFQELTEYILPQLDHEDEKAVILGYGAYRRALEDSFHLEHIKEELYQVREGTADSAKTHREYYKDEGHIPFPAEEEAAEEPEEVEEGLFRRDEYRRDSSERTAEKKSGKDPEPGIWKKVIGCIAGVAVLMAILAAKVFGYLPGFGVEMILGIVLIAMGAGMLGFRIYKRVKGNGAVQKNRKEERKQPASFSLREETGIEAGIQKHKLEEDSGEYRPQFGALHKKDDRKDRRTPAENYGETVVLSASPVAGPASLVSREPGELATIYLQEEMTIIGKLEVAADAVINLPTVSRVHAKIRKKEEEYYLSDLNSRNGTSVNGRMLKGEEEYLLQDQDEVDFAQARYVFLK